MIIKILAEGGSMKPGPALSQKLGPAGINVSQVISKINEATNNFQGLKVPVELNVNTSTKEFEVKVFSPPVSELLKREIGIDKGSGAQKKDSVANASIEQIISVSKTKIPNMLSNTLKTAVKSVVGTCVSLGILIENKPAKEIELMIDEGKYDKEILGEITITSEDKKTKLKKYFTEIKAEQEKIAKIAAEKEKEAAEAAKPAEGAVAATPTTATATPEKKEEKKKEVKKK
jgi:large subunit ribosomal protein L11